MGDTDRAAGRTPLEQLERPVDQYQRYDLTSKLVRALDVPAGARILDLGGAPGPIETFLPDYEVFVLDIQGEHDGGRFVIADGGALPFPDGSFEAVVSLDTLEHVPTSIRQSFLREARRVSRRAVVLSAPFATPGVAAAERALLDFISARLSPEFPTAVWLQEHVDWGLPVLEQTLADLSDEAWVSDALPSGYLPRWLTTMIVDHEMLATGLPELDALHAYYNEFVSPADARTPAYRHIVAASRQLDAAELARRVRALASADEDSVEVSAATSGMAAALMQQRLGTIFSSGALRASEAEGKRLEEQVHALERVVADRDAHLSEVNQDKLALQQQVRELQNHLAGLSLRGLIRRTTRGKLG
jgi:SAM-dependent methyltransferase